MMFPAAILTVSHFNRASNHNLVPAFGDFNPTVSHFNRASNHNAAPGQPLPDTLFHISIEHQNTTGATCGGARGHCFTFQCYGATNTDLQSKFSKINIHTL